MLANGVYIKSSFNLVNVEVIADIQCYIPIRKTHINEN